MSKYYLIGKGIETSLSPAIHNRMFALKGLRREYFLFKESVPYRLEDALSETTFGGLSITIPFKTHYHEHPNLKYQCEFSQQHHVINTIVKAKVMIGCNTDIFGIAHCLDPLLPRIEHSKAILIGAGATALTFCAYLQAKKIPVTVINRSVQHGNKLMEKCKNVREALPLSPVRRGSDETGPYSLLINTLPSQAVHEHFSSIDSYIRKYFNGKADSTSLSPMAYMDVNYRGPIDPIYESLLRSGKLEINSGRGLDMLLWQAIEQNRLFCGEASQHRQQTQWYFDRLKRELNLQ